MKNANEPISRFAVVIPARIGSTRLPNKPLQLLGGKPLIFYAVDIAQRSGCEKTIVATDHQGIAEVAVECGAEACMTDPNHASGTDRIAEVAAKQGWPDDFIVVNLQGDEPFIPPTHLSLVASTLRAHPDCAMATLKSPLWNVADLFDPNCVKVVVDTHGRAIYFSRAPIPWPRDAFARDQAELPAAPAFFRHLGIYAYRVDFLRRFGGLARGPLEKAESLEQLRALESGYAIAVAKAPGHPAPGIDSEEDLRRAEALLRQTPA